MKEYWIIDIDITDDCLDSHTARGPFATLRSAETWLRQDAAETYLAADGSLRDESDKIPWAKPVHIVGVVKTVEQVPSVKVTVKLKSV